MKYKTVVIKYNPRAKKRRKKWKKPQTNMPKKAGICLRFPLLFRQKPYSYSKSPMPGNKNRTETLLWAKKNRRLASLSEKRAEMKQAEER